MQGPITGSNGPALGGRPSGVSFDFLGLPNCVTTNLHKFSDFILVRASYELPNPPAKCSFCPGIQFLQSPRLREQIPIWDTPRVGRPVLIQLSVTPWVCKGCRRAQNVTVSWYHKTRKMTKRLAIFIRMRAATLTTFSQIALDTCQDDETVASIFMQAFKTFDKKRSKDLPRVLGIDEVYFSGRAFTILVDIETGKAVDLLKGMRSEVIRSRLEEASNRDAVEYVTQDFSATYWGAITKPLGETGKKEKGGKSKKNTSATSGTESPLAGYWQALLFSEWPETEFAQLTEEERAAHMSTIELKALLPNAKIVGDHFHFKQAIVKAGFNAVRLHVKKTLRRYYYPKMEAYFTKEQEQSQLRGLKFTPRKVKKMANEAVKARSLELDKYKLSLFKCEAKLELDELSRVKGILDDHPLLARAWVIKNKGLNIFPEQPPLGRSKKSREAAMIRRAKLRMTEEDAAKRLYDWAKELEADPELAEYFKRALNMIRNWRTELIRIGTTGHSNAGTEEKNRYLRRIAAISRGLRFESLRARLLWADEHRHTNRWPSFCYDFEGRIDPGRVIELALAEVAHKEAAKAAPLNTRPQRPDTDSNSAPSAIQGIYPT